MPRSSTRLTKRFQVMLYTPLGNVSLPESLEAVHLLGGLAGHDLNCGPLVDDLEVSRLHEHVDDRAAVHPPDVDALAADNHRAVARDPAPDENRFFGADWCAVGETGALKTLALGRLEGTSEGTDDNTVGNNVADGGNKVGGAFLYIFKPPCCRRRLRRRLGQRVTLFSALEGWVGILWEVPLHDREQLADHSARDRVKGEIVGSAHARNG